MQSDSQKRLARRASIKELSNKAEGIYYYIKPQNMLFRLISAGNELASAINGAVAYFTNFAQSGSMDDTASREVIDRIYRKVGSMIAVDGSLQTRQYQDKQGNKRTAVEVLANNISFAGAKTADKPAARDFDRQTQNYTHEEKTAQSAPQPRFTDGQLDAIPKAERYNADSAVFSDTDDLPF